MSRTRSVPRRGARRLALAIAVCIIVLSAPSTAFGHASLMGAVPSPGSKIVASPELVALRFTEPVELVARNPGDVVNSEGEVVAAGAARVSAGDARVVEIPLRPELPEGTYTVRYTVIGADSHVIPGVFVFGIGAGELEEPYLGNGTAGPSETSAWGVSARFLEISSLGALIGLLAFRWLVWAPAVGRSAGLGGAERTAILSWWRDLFWVSFGVLAVVAMVAEGYLLVVQSASALGVDVRSALADGDGISSVLGDTRFGTLVQIRGALLFGVFALGAMQFMREYGSSGEPKPPSETGGRAGALTMAVLLLAVVWSVSTQGHPSVGTFTAFQIGTQLAHIVAVSIWIAGLALVAVATRRLPAVAPTGGRTLAAHVLARFSKVALVVVAIAVLTGVVRSLDELAGPAELWETAYGRSIVLKVLLLVPIGVLALSNRRVVVALRRVQRPNAATLRRVRRSLTVELVLSMGIVVVAALLVAQVPGGS